MNAAPTGECSLAKLAVKNDWGSEKKEAKDEACFLAIEKCV